MTQSGAQYREYRAQGALAAHVACFWRFRGAEESAPQPIVPDGRPELIIHLGVPYREGPSGERQASILFAGQLTRPLNLLSDGPVEILGVRFRPDGARGFCGRPVDLATDRRVPLREWHGEAADGLEARLRGACSEERQQVLLADYIMERTADAPPDAMIREAVDAILADRAFDPPATVSQRQFQRRFRRTVGISPRMLRSVRRFRTVFDRLQTDEDRGWCDRALAAGYFDQPQMARDFRRFLGCTAREWLGQEPGLARHLGETAG